MYSTYQIFLDAIKTPPPPKSRNGKAKKSGDDDAQVDLGKNDSPTNDEPPENLSDTGRKTKKLSIVDIKDKAELNVVIHNDDSFKELNKMDSTIFIDTIEGLLTPECATPRITSGVTQTTRVTECASNKIEPDRSSASIQVRLDMADIGVDADSTQIED